jgi:REP element-mobilizing transposase RayT
MTQQNETPQTTGAGYYFITLASQDTKGSFGKLCKGEMKLNKCGELVEQQWLEIAKHFPNIVLHSYVVMPCHMHGIIEVTTETVYTLDNAELALCAPFSDKSLSRIMRWFKHNATVACHRVAPEFEWHRGYREHKVRSEEELGNCIRYIENNPKYWSFEDEQI